MSQWRGWIVPAVVGVIIGVALTWWLNRPVPPWIEFNSVVATYERGSQVVHVSGEYTANKVCSRAEQKTAAEAPPPLVWRQDVRGTGAEIVSYAPKPEPPTLELGTHSFRTEIPLAEGIEPDGWTVSITVSCDTEAFAVRSKAATVEYLPARSGAIVPGWARESETAARSGASAAVSEVGPPPPGGLWPPAESVV